MNRKLSWKLSWSVLFAAITGSALTVSAWSQESVGDHTVSRHAAVVNVTCNDGQSDTTRLNHAISTSAVGSEIDIHGICLINKTIVLRGDRSYIGDSRTGTILRQASGANLAAILASDSWDSNSSTTGDPVRIAHLTIDGGDGGGGATGADGLIIRSWMTVVQDVLVENVSGDGIQITAASKDGVPLTNTQVNGRISNVFITGVGGNGIHVVDSGNSVTDWDLLNSWIGGTGLSGISMDNAAGWKIRGNHLYGIQKNAIYANRCFGTTIDSNYIEGFGAAGGGGTWYGIACTVQGDVASVISGNKVFQFDNESGNGTYIYIGIPQVNYGTGVANVVDNAIYGANGGHDIGLSYQLGNGSALRLLSANNVQNVAIPRRAGSGVTFVTAQ